MVPPPRLRPHRNRRVLHDTVVLVGWWGRRLWLRICAGFWYAVGYIEGFFTKQP